jgi:hypothetical protein
MKNEDPTLKGVRLALSLGSSFFDLQPVALNLRRLGWDREALQYRTPRIRSVSG